ncbi:hypothetical protein C8J56DRAFT_12874 [Mycena floridula]|nr:hypothetical protein C8J56DRAFT_12874 [Mycena floridula]
MSSASHIPTANTCQHCDKHLHVIHAKGTQCPRCLPETVTALKTCACHLARYCDADCQKADWKNHKSECLIAKQNIDVSHVTGSEARHLSFVKWCKHSREQFVFPAVWALDAGTSRDKTGSHIFVIYIEEEEEVLTNGKMTFKRWVRTAKCASEDEIHQEFSWRYSSGHCNVPAAQPLCARLWIVDDGFPHGLEAVHQVTELLNIGRVRSEVFSGMNCDWLALLKDSVAAGAAIPPDLYIYRLGSTPSLNALRYNSNKRWKEKYGEHFAIAAFSALDIPRHLQRIVTHCLVIYIDVDESSQGVFSSHRIRSAKMATLAEIRPLFHCDIYGHASAFMKLILFAQPKLLRTLIIDDTLPLSQSIDVVAMDMGRLANPTTVYRYRSDWLETLKKTVEK